MDHLKERQKQVFADLFAITFCGTEFSYRLSKARERPSHYRRQSDVRSDAGHRLASETLRYILVERGYLFSARLIVLGLWV
jgi:hypothetical protein